MTSQREEILIQRCVDNECTSAERRELIECLDNGVDGWKNLACTYMEEQLFAAGCSSSASPVVQPQVAPVNGNSALHWFNHPAVSMVLSACVVFLLGVIGAGEYQRWNVAQSPAVTQDNAAASDGSVRDLGTLGSATLVNKGSVREPQRAWLEADGMAPREVPIYQKMSEFLPYLAEFRQQGDQWSRGLGPGQSKPRISYKLVKTDDGLLLLPVEEFLFDQQMH